MATLADRYCTHHAVQPHHFARHALYRSLPLRAQLSYPLLSIVPGFFDSDLEFIREVGRASSLRDFAIDAADFKLHPDNSHPLRRLLKLRVSSRKLRRLLAASLAAPSARSQSVGT